MAVLTPIDLRDAQRIGLEYGLSIASIRGLLVGSVNTNYQCTFDSGEKAILRIYEEQGAEGAEREIRLVKHLGARGIPTVVPFSRKGAGRDSGSELSSYAGKAVSIAPWVEGEGLCQKRVTIDVLEQVGRALAQIHRAAAGFEGAPRNRFDVSHLRKRIERLRGLGYGKSTPSSPVSGGEIGEDVERLSSKLEAYASREAARGGPPPSAVVHGDVFRENVLWQGGRIAAVLDFESASLGAVTFDLCVTMLAWCYDDDLKLDFASALMRSYARENPLTAGELTRLYEDALFATLRFSITRITDCELRPKGVGIYKDYRRFLGRLNAIEALGAEGLLSLFEEA